MSAPALPVGIGRDRLRLFDNQWCVMHDSAVNPAPVYPYIATWIHAVIDYGDGSRWVGQMYRCPEGIKREAYPTAEYLKYLTEWPTFEEFAS